MGCNVLPLPQGAVELSVNISKWADLELSCALVGVVRADGRKVEPRMGRVHGTAGFEEAVASDKHRVEHALAQQEVAHPLRNDDVHLLGQLHGLYSPLDHLHHPTQLRNQTQESRCCHNDLAAAQLWANKHNSYEAP